MTRKAIVALFALAAVGLVQPTVALRRHRIVSIHAPVKEATYPSVPMMVRHRSSESLVSHGRRTTITWSCKTKKLKRTVPPGLAERVNDFETA